MRELEFNQKDVEPKQYLRYPNGEPKAELVHILKPGDCPSCYEKDPMIFTDGVKVYRRLWNPK